jgi:molecular chaperone DnaK
MSTTINFGIDLGTTNSLIAKSSGGNVEIFKNPAGHKETLPSVVGFRKERVLVGDKAREYIEKDAANVFSSFKRKMGTSENFFVPALGDFRTPIQLSSMVLAELKNFVYTGESLGSAIITIPASFDTMQSNATKEAGYKAGFSEVVLLQEPIAACLAFVNKNGEKIEDGNRLVYDLGGGTFDVALVSIKNGEMQVIDHEGNNYLGGVDVDNLIIEKFIIPEIEKKGKFANLKQELKSASGKHNKLYYELLYKAEEAKIMLSNTNTTDIEFEIDDDEDETLDLVISFTREQFNELIKPMVAETISFSRAILDRNKISAENVNEVMLVGGSTYIPLVRQMLQQELSIVVNTSVDPTTAVVVGAAYYAGTKPRVVQATASVQSPVIMAAEQSLQVKTAYQRSSNETMEYFSALIQGDLSDVFYRITREDGGFDSGIRPAKSRIEEVLYLLPNSFNQFRLSFFNGAQVQLPVNVPLIEIMQGKFTVYGQPLPNDICLEVDDVINKTTYLEVLFEKNAILPIKKTIVKTLSRTIVKSSNDQLLINVLEGSRYATAQSNLPIGVIGISGKDINIDLIKGSDIDLTIEITESRDIKINAYVNISGQEFSEVFTPTSRNINLERLKEEVEYLQRVANKDLAKLINNEDYESGRKLQDAITNLDAIQDRLNYLASDDVTDEKFQLEDQKRKIATIIDGAGKDNRVREIRERYFERKEIAAYFVGQLQNEHFKKRFTQITQDENEVLNGSESAIKRKIDELDHLNWDMRKRDLSYLSGVFMYYSMRPDADYRDPSRAAQLKQRGESAIERKSADELLNILYALYDMLIDKGEDEPLKGTGLG